ncbi:MAG: type II toxin-antitoxin system VapB family antitoxin [Bosea sp.]|uniref:type II toxin-antitoxin system VapB family antitoxin n=1 Tax=Bosea sp. (in: a-proteobacteria) TaxID=1871050 RepID=UPI001AC21440|nr:type II toxin-antitoxin system VapB family antitoxin [Bosea sp. (in: a-proteobacteria)]MBN9467545.1 type II toxin-antitoxin system VapB family antitoxin [Bosea sp. (in: a-proteobacteria)]
MTILIKDPETDRIVRELAARTGKTITEAVRNAAERELSDLCPRKGRIDRVKVEKLLAEIDAMPKINDDLSDDEIIGYDENGVPS